MFVPLTSRVCRVLKLQIDSVKKREDAALEKEKILNQKEEVIKSREEFLRIEGIKIKEESDELSFGDGNNTK